MEQEIKICSKFPVCVLHFCRQKLNYLGSECFCEVGANRSLAALVNHLSVDTPSRYVNINNVLNVDCSRRKHSPIGRMFKDYKTLKADGWVG